MQNEYNESEFLIETIVPKDELIVSRTDLKGNITYANETFAQISGYTVDELIGKPHNCVRHPDMPKQIFEELWNSLKSNNSWKGIIKNLRKDKGFYWVYAQISVVKKDDKIVEYKSIRTPISFQDKIKYQKLYDEIKKETKDLQRKVIYQ
ncbi:chemotaxis protein [Malaciobacter molluscorum]|uniref:PAS domain-containing protein n=1 Tax=Malaciobacter molluscorum TaxID=1032072 RepID=UPI00100BAB0A|nr:PAS domain-containing protein [Malaciobacter molluscorum]RXJ94410.1 chemotaxis protein [Malaciobacter molluscorum]